MVVLLQIEHPQSGEGTVAVDDVGYPAQLLDGFEGTTDEEDRALIVVVADLGVYIEDGLTLEEVIVVDEVHLQASRREGSDLDDQRMIIIVDDHIDSREADDFMQLVAALVDDAEARHEDTDLIPQFLYPLRQLACCRRNVGLGKVGEDLLRDIQYSS